jgi:predicted TIM-barrel fold metal-dependent hydrolase
MSASAVAGLCPGMEVIDVHAHLGKWGCPGSIGDADELRRLIDRAGFSKAIVSSGLAIMYDVPGGNAEVARAVESDERLYGSVVFNARNPKESRAEIERYAGHPRFVAAKFHPSYTGLALNSPENMKVIELVAEKKLPLTFHSWTGDGAAASEIARRFPKLPVIWFHARASDYRQAAELARKLPNVYLEYVTSTQERGKVELLVERLGADRILFGTDESLFDPVRPLGQLVEAEIGDRDRRKILGLNARKLFDFEKG